MGQFITLNYNIGYLRRGQTFMYFQIESNLRENYGNFDILNNKTKFIVRNFTQVASNDHLL